MPPATVRSEMLLAVDNGISVDSSYLLEADNPAGHAKNQDGPTAHEGQPCARRRRCFSSGSGYEHVADAAHGADNVGMCGIGLDLATQPSDAQIDRAVERLHLAMGSHFQ